MTAAPTPGDATRRRAHETGGPAPERDGRRLVVAAVRPHVHNGRFAVKRTIGERFTVEADVFTDGHDRLSVVLCHRSAGAPRWDEVDMVSRHNDVWVASFIPDRVGEYEYRVEAWIDHFASWRDGLVKKSDAGQDVSSELQEGAALVGAAAVRADASDGEWLSVRAERLRADRPEEDRLREALEPSLLAVMRRHADRGLAVSSDAWLPLRVERERARFGAWYEMFPRSAAPRDGRGSTLREAEVRLAEIAAMGFDVLYLPPIHPIGSSHRKGPNNSVHAGPGDPGSPWAIGAESGGHKSVAPELGTMEDFDHFIASATRHGLEIALDIAFQCSPDHPYVREHPEWFRKRPDGTIQYAENPPKKYQDIYPFDFECADWQGLWEELKSIVVFWAERGVRIFRIDNPHTKPFRFWEWLIGDVQRQFPDAIFLAEAFTRPKVMQWLAKSGFTQSYTYFTWRTTKSEIETYFTELTGTDVREYLRPNLFANTPDILHESLQFGGRPAFQARAVLAATLGANYGIYGPAFELCEGAAVPGTEEYRDSEKYQVRIWERDSRGHIRDFITRVNEIRRSHPALQHDHTLRFHRADNEQMLFYSKLSPDGADLVLVVVNLDPHHVQEGWIHVPLDEFGIAAGQSYQAHDLIGDARYFWEGERSFIRLDPQICPAHIFVIRRRLHTERDFDYFQ
jgi:starch synthase (maltosyl-transferring)